MKNTFGEKVTPENIVRRTCCVSYQRNQYEDEIEVVYSKVVSLKSIFSENKFSVFLELENGFSVQIFVNPIFSVEDLFIFEPCSWMDAILSEDEGWVLCIIKSGVEFKKNHRKNIRTLIFGIIPAIKVPYNAKLKTL